MHRVQEKLRNITALSRLMQSEVGSILTAVRFNPDEEVIVRELLHNLTRMEITAQNHILPVGCER